MILLPTRENYPDSLAILDTPENDKELYMRLIVSSASAYFETDPITRYLFKKRFQLVDNYLQKQKKQWNSIIDVGCGIGFFLPTLAQYGNHVSGLDYSEDILEYAEFMTKKRSLDNVSFKKGSILSLPFEDNSFDLIVSMSVLEHFENPEDPIREIKRIATDDALIILGYPSETPVFHFLHETLSRIVPKRQKISKIFDEEDPGEEFHAPHVANANTIQNAIESLDLLETKRQSIWLLPKVLELYRINFLKKS